MKLKSPDIEALLQRLVAESEVNRAALMVLTTSRDHAQFAQLFTVEVDALLAKADLANPHERWLHELLRASRDRLLGVGAAGIPVH